MTGGSPASVRQTSVDPSARVLGVLIAGVLVGGAVSLLDFPGISPAWLLIPVCLGVGFLGVAVTQARERFWSPSRIEVTVRSLFIVQAVLLVIGAARRLAEEPLLLVASSLATAGLLVVCWNVLSSESRPRRAVLWLTVVLGALAWITGGTFLDVGIDVLTFQELGLDRLMSGQNPYAIGYLPDIYDEASSRAFYGPGLSVDGVLQFGFPYFPLSLLFALPGWLLGNVKIAHWAAMVAVTYLLVRIGGWGWPGRLGLIFFVTNPLAPQVVWTGWTEPFILVIAALLVLRSLRGAPGQGVVFGVLLSLKQYAVLLLPLSVLLWDWRSIKGGLVRELAKSALVGALVTIPFFLWDPEAFWFSVVQLQGFQPLRPDGVSVLVTSVGLTGWPPASTYNLIPFGAALSALGCVLWRGRRGAFGFAAAAAFVLGVFVLSSKQGVTNYYFLVSALAFLAVAADRGQAQEGEGR